MIEPRARVAALWSTPAAFRALRAALVVPGLFALTAEGIGNLEMATFAAFGGFATLVMASFGGSRRDKLLAHLGLAVVGSVLLTIGTAVHAAVWPAVVVTLLVGFAVLFAGVIGPNVAAGGTAALLAFVLPAASPGSMEAIPSRLAGWWLASVVGTAAVLLIAPRPGADRVRAATATLARTLGERLDAALRGADDAAAKSATIEAKHRLMELFTAQPYRPTGLTTSDQALAGAAGIMEWLTGLLNDCLTEHPDLSAVIEVEKELFTAIGSVLHDVAELLDGDTTDPDLDRLDQALEQSVTVLRHMDTGGAGYAAAVDLSFHARTLGFGARTAARDALVVVGRTDESNESDSATTVSVHPLRRFGVLSSLGGLTLGHTSLRSVWFLNSVRGAVGLAAATAVADLSGVQHAFWVVLGTLSVLRTSAAATGATALRALAGTVVGFALGAALLSVIGTGQVALWIALPLVTLIAAYAPGIAPFAIGQAAFTLTVSVLYNLLVPVGWQVGVLRVQDVAIGCLVSLVVGTLFWPRGAGKVVRDDLADAYHQGGDYLAGAVEWALGLRQAPPDPARTRTADLRLDEAVRGYLAERGTKRMPREDLWRLVNGTTRLRLTARSLAGLPPRRTGLPAATGSPVILSP
ncbi:FUSC family protein [Nocardia macrotermitis]|nr:FUSC family protein [Nocardia macrotermitis]